jgi:hypothetical protein
MCQTRCHEIQPRTSTEVKDELEREVAFSRLIQDVRYADATGAPIDLVGTITWTWSG